MIKSAASKGRKKLKNMNEKYFKTEMKFYEGKTITNFHNAKLLKEGSYCICLSVILIDSFFKWVKTIILKYF